MAQILKLRNGALAYQQAQLEYLQAYLTADDNTKRWLDGFMTLGANAMRQDLLSNGNQKGYLTRLYQIGTEMATSGKNNYVAPSASPRAASKNYWGNYDDEELVINANNVARRYVGNKQNVGTLQNSPIKNHYTYKWDSDLSSDWNFESDSLANRLITFAGTLLNNLSKAIERNNAGDIVHGMALDKVTDFNIANQGLQEFLANLDVQNGTYKGKKIDTQAIKDLSNIARKVGVDPVAFKEYFGDYIPRETEKSINLRARRQDNLDIVNPDELGYNQDVINYLAKNKINLMRDPEGNVYAFNENYSQSAPLLYLNRDWRQRDVEGSTYNWGIFSDSNGKVWYGDYGQLANDDPWYAAITNYKNSLDADRATKYHIYNDFHPTLNYTGDNKTVHDFVSRLGAAANLDPNMKLNNFVDISEMFKGNKQIIAVKKDGTPFSNEGLNDGTIEFDPDTILFYLGDDNLLHSTTWSDPALETKLGKYNPDGWNETTNQIGSQLKGLNLGESTIAADQIGNPQEWANRMIDLMSKPKSQRTTEDIKELEKYGALGDKRNALSYIYSLIAEQGIQLDADRLKKWHDLTKDFRTDNLATSLVLSDDEQDLKLIEEANKAGYESVADYLGSLKKGFSDVEIMRLAALAADIASFGSSFALGAGTIASGILGAGASGTEFAADIMQDGFLWGDLGRFGVNLGLDFVGLLPGGKGLKITKNAVKTIARSLPFLISAWSAIANGDKYIEVAKKVADGKVKDLTAQDWQTLAQGIRLLIGGARTVKATSGAYKSAYLGVKSGINKGYHAIADPIKHEKAVIDRAKKTGAFRKGEGYLPIEIKPKTSLPAAIQLPAPVSQLSSTQTSITQPTSLTTTPATPTVASTQAPKQAATTQAVTPAQKGRSTKAKNELLNSETMLSGELISKLLGKMTDADLKKIANDNGLSVVINVDSKGNRVVNLNQGGNPVSYEKLKQLFYSGKIKIDGKTPKFDNTGQRSLFNKQGGQLDRFGEYLKSHK